MSSRLGDPVELPWWVVPLAAPPVGVMLAGALLVAPLWARLAVVLGSVLTLAVLVRVAVRVTSRSMQSVWVSAVYAVWVFVTLTWVVALLTQTGSRSS